MMYFKGFLFSLTVFLLPFVAMNVSAQTVNFDDNFASHLIDAEPDSQGRVESVFDWGIDKNKTLIENIRELFYPDASGKGGKIYDLMRPIVLGLFILFLVYAGVTTIFQAADGDNAREKVKGILYIILGAFIFYLATWILGVALNLDGNLGSQGLVDNAQNNVLFQLLAALKAGAFFAAIVMMIWYGWRIMSGLDKEERLKEGRQGILNILIALILIKVIDFLFYIAQARDFQDQATEFIVVTAKVLGWILGAMMVVMVLYAGFMLIVSGGRSEALDKVKSVIIGIFLGSLVIFMFLLIIYQVVQEFAS